MECRKRKPNVGMKGTARRLAHAVQGPCPTNIKVPNLFNFRNRVAAVLLDEPCHGNALGRSKLSCGVPEGYPLSPRKAESPHDRDVCHGILPVDLGPNQLCTPPKLQYTNLKAMRRDLNTLGVSHVCREPNKKPCEPCVPKMTLSFIPELVPENIGSYFWMGEHTLKVPMTLFAENRCRLNRKLCREQRDKIPSDAVVLLQGGSAVPLHSTDVDYNVFRQEPYMFWAFGVTEPDCFGAIVVSSGESILFIPRLPEEYAMWMGPLKTPCDFKKKYEVEKVAYTDEIAHVLGSLSEPAVTLLTLVGQNTDSGLTTHEATFEGIDKFKVDNEILFPAITECRVIKSEAELEVIKYTNKISSRAHKLVMRKARPGMMEYQCESIFLNYCYYVGGCRHVSYTCICGSGANGSVLHYGHAAAPNDKTIHNGDMCLFDMGCNYYGYASDITCSFPANGKFTNDQKNIYNAVLAASNAVMKAAAPGKSWCCMHWEAYKAMLLCLREMGLVRGEVEDMLDAQLGAVFQPHGLGHLLGLDVHDVGGYMENTPPRPVQPGFNKLRTARILEEGMVLTVEPGCYFIDHLLDKALADPMQAKFLVKEEIERLRGFGGVRIEDNVVVTATGVVNLTQVPRTVDEIEEWMRKTDHEVAVENLIAGHADSVRCSAVVDDFKADS